ncbi:MAK10-like protein [Tanacetum coccineum]|uniref:MAK10-like protein n=1 Tax=Tanacetum coccineum TaxID=301880 RepID=A0ABQ5G1X2_9ASTR
MVRAASTRVWFRLSTMPFYCGVGLSFSSYYLFSYPIIVNDPMGDENHNPHCVGVSRLAPTFCRYTDRALGIPSRSRSITTWEDLTTRFLAQLFPSGRTAKLRNKNTEESWEIIENLALYDHEGPSPQSQALETIFEDRIRDYMATHTERMERFENAIFKQREGINSRMTEMFGLLKELTTSKTPEKVLIREEAKFPITKNVNSISQINGEEEWSNITKVTPDNTEKPTETEAEMIVKKAETKNGAEHKAENKSSKNEETLEAPGSQPITYYLKHKIKEKLIRGLVNNNRFNNSRSEELELERKRGRNINIGDLKHVNALVDQGSDVNIMPYSTYMKLTNERPAETDIRLSLASYSYIYPLGIAEDMLVEVAKHVYPADFMILDIKGNKKKPFILGTSFLTTAKASIKFDKGTITLRSGKSKASPGIGRKVKASFRKEDEVQPIEEQKFQRQALYLMRRSLEVLRKFHWMILEGRFNQSSHVSSPLLSKQGEY